MKKYIYKFSVGTISCFLIIAAICILSTACTKEDTATKKIDNKSKSFSLAPYECNIIGEINVAELSKLDSAKKQIESNKNTAFVKELDNAGMGWNNISRIYFAISPPSQIQDNNNPPPPSALILLKSNNKIDIEKLIPIVERETKKKVTSEKIDKQTVYLISLDNNELVCLSELTDNLVAIGTKSIITKTIDLFNGKGKSVVDNAQLMKLSDNAKCDNMFWISGVVDKKLLKSFGIENPTIQVQGGLIYADYLSDILTIGGNIKCATKQDAQNVLMPAQMLTSILTSNPKSGIKAEDISLTANNSELNIKISLSKQVLESLAKQQMQNMSANSPQLEVQTSPALKTITPTESYTPSPQPNNQ